MFLKIWRWDRWRSVVQNPVKRIYIQIWEFLSTQNFISRRSLPTKTQSKQINLSFFDPWKQRCCLKSWTKTVLLKNFIILSQIKNFSHKLRSIYQSSNRKNNFSLIFLPFIRLKAKAKFIHTQLIKLWRQNFSFSLGYIIIFLVEKIDCVCCFFMVFMIKFRPIE